MIITGLLRKLFFVFSFTALVACGENGTGPAALDQLDADTPSEGPGTILEVAQGAGSFETLITAIEAAGLENTLADDSGQFTVFAPTDAAFAALGENTIAELLGDISTLADILAYHVIADQAVDANTAISLNGSDVEMLNGDTVSISVQDDVLYINDSAVIVADITAANGVIHVIDAVLSPPEG